MNDTQGRVVVGNLEVLYQVANNSARCVGYTNVGTLFKGFHGALTNKVA